MFNTFHRLSMCLLFATFILMTSTGCETFNDRWNAASKESFPATNKAGRILMAGRWAGTWQSTDEHEGTLRAIIRPHDVDKGTYVAEFHATYAKVLWQGYEVIFETKFDEGKLTTEGEAELGWFSGGKFTYKGVVNRNYFWSDYDSKKHKGKFVLKRIP